MGARTQGNDKRGGAPVVFQVIVVTLLAAILACILTVMVKTNGAATEMMHTSKELRQTRLLETVKEELPGVVMTLQHIGAVVNDTLASEEAIKTFRENIRKAVEFLV